MHLYRLWTIDETGHRSRPYAVETDDAAEVGAFARTLLTACVAVEVWLGDELLQTVRPSTLH